MLPMSPYALEDSSRRRFLSMVGRGTGLAALASPVVSSLLEDLHAAVRSIEGLSPEQVAQDGE